MPARSVTLLIEPWNPASPLVTTPPFPSTNQMPSPEGVPVAATYGAAADAGLHVAAASTAPTSRAMAITFRCGLFMLFLLPSERPTGARGQGLGRASAPQLPLRRRPTVSAVPSASRWHPADRWRGW